MLDLTRLGIGLFEMKIQTDKGIVKIDLTEPKLKVIRKISKFQKRDDFGALSEVVLLILNSNKEGRKFSADFIEDNFTLNQMQEFFRRYIDWIKGVKNNPN